MVQWDLYGHQEKNVVKYVISKRKIVPFRNQEIRNFESKHSILYS